METTDWHSVLYQDYCQYALLDQRQIDWLADRGVSREAMSGSWLIKTARVTFEGKERFVQNSKGTDVFILVVEENTEIIDLLAWELRSGRLATFRGHAFALGQDQILSAGTYALGGKLRVHRSPLSWLRAERRGIVILKPRETYAWLGQVLGIEAEDSAHARELEDLIKPPAPSAQITFPGEVKE